MEAVTQRCSLNRCSWKVRKKTRKIPVTKFMFMFISQRFYENGQLFLPIFMEKIYFQKATYFFWIKIRRLLKQKIESFGPSKTTLYFWLKINFRKMASNKHIRKEKRGDIWQLWKNLKPQDHSILPLNWYSFMTFEMQAK